MFSNLGNWFLALIQLIVSSFAGVLGYIFKKDISKIDELEKRQAAFEKYAAENYVKKSEYKQMDISEVMQGIKDLEIKISDNYMKKNEFYRYSGEIGHKLDTIYELLLKERSN